MFCRIARFSVFSCQEDATGAALKKAALGSGQQINRLRLHPLKWRLRLRNTD